MTDQAYKNLLAELTHKQQAFVEAYTGNATEAAKIAGYACPDLAGHRALRHDKICRAIHAKDAPARKARIADAQALQDYWTKMLYEDAGVSAKDKLKASELLGRSQALFTEKILRLNDLDSKPLDELRGELDRILAKLEASPAGRKYIEPQPAPAPEPPQDHETVH